VVVVPVTGEEIEHVDHRQSESQNSPGWKGPLETIWSNFLWEQSLRLGCLGPSLGYFQQRQPMPMI